MKKFNIIRLLSIVTIAAAGVFGVANFKSQRKSANVDAATNSVTLAGSFNGWSTTANPLTLSGDYWIIQRTFAANETFKIVVNGSDWVGDGDGVSWCSGMGSEGKGNNFKVLTAGNYFIKAVKTIGDYGDKSYGIVFKKGYTVTFNMNGHGTAPSSQVIEDGQKASQPSNPTASGYTFDGWYQEAACTNSWDFSTNTVTSNKILYAKWIQYYTITYDRNKNTGLQATQRKYPNTSVTAYTPGSSPLTDSGWDPSPFKRFVSWNTHYTGGGTTYSAGTTITTDASFYLYYIEDWYNFRYRINSGSWVNLFHNDDGMDGSLYQAQFAPVSAQSLPLNGIIHLQYSADGGSNWSDISSVTFAGNYDNTTGIELATVDTIYLQITKSNTYRCWVPGISDRTIAVFDSSSATSGATPYTMRGNGDNETVTTMDVPIRKGQFVKRGYGGNYTYGSYFAGGTGNAASCFTQVGSETAVECIITGVYTVYNQKGSYENWKDIYFTRNEEASASLLAQIFNETIAPICADITAGSKSLTQLQAAWGSNSTTLLYNHFHGQFSDTMNYFKTSSSTSDADILACVARYDYIVKKYGTTALPDFLSRNNGYTANPQGSKLLMSFTNKDPSKIVIITLISVISVSAIGGYFFIKKRKENY